MRSLRSEGADVSVDNGGSLEAKSSTGWVRHDGIEFSALSWRKTTYLETIVLLVIFSLARANRWCNNPQTEPTP